MPNLLFVKEIWHPSHVFSTETRKNSQNHSKRSIVKASKIDKKRPSFISLVSTGSWVFQSGVKRNERFGFEIGLEGRFHPYIRIKSINLLNKQNPGGLNSMSKAGFSLTFPSAFWNLLLTIDSTQSTKQQVVLGLIFLKDLSFQSGCKADLKRLCVRRCL